VETKHSFLNGLVASLTLAMYTPMSIEVTCAAPALAPQAPKPPASSSPAPGKARASR
jgi:hypothetical protein